MGYLLCEIEAMLKEYGMIIEEEVGVDEYQQRYLLPPH